MRFPVAPMKAVLGALPGAAEDEHWAYEIKWDGYRTILHVRDGRVRVQSSGGADVSGTYPELAALGRSLNARSGVIDGEMVVLDPEGRPRFELIQRHEHQVAFYAFDVLELDDRETVALPYEARRALLADALDAGPNWMVPAHRVGDGAALLAATAERGLEGIMAKRLGSPYLPGRRSPLWRKVKNRVRERVVVGGWAPGSGARSGTLGSLLVGVREPDGRLRFGGGVGTGFTEETLAHLSGELRARETPTCPFDPAPPAAVARTAHWVRPELVAEIEIAEWTNIGVVRHASFIRLVG